ncbi:MAG: FAD synthase [Candidatus Heimdallarchaeota archaeon AB_125]|nr:MAG: FAD synthase [Candidatus Heimdallarchaeota archaeon AB_125]
MTGIEYKLVIKQIYINSLKGIKSSLTSISRQLGFSLEFVSTLIESLVEKGSVEVDPDNKYHLTVVGRKLISVVLTGGTFDILHVGHLFTFNQSKLLGDVLVVVLATDRNVEKLKKHTPTNSQEDRVELVDHVKAVDAAIIGDEDDFMKIMDLVQPDIITVGFDQKHDERDLYNTISSKGYSHVKIIRLQKHVSGKSTSKIVQEIIKHNYRQFDDDNLETLLKFPD